MKLIKENDFISYNQKYYNDGSIISDFLTLKVYYNERTKIRIEYSKRGFIIEEQYVREPLPDFTGLSEEQLFQYSTVYDVYSFIEIQEELKK